MLAGIIGCITFLAAFLLRSSVISSGLSLLGFKVGTEFLIISMFYNISDVVVKKKKSTFCDGLKGKSKLLTLSLLFHVSTVSS